MHHRTRALIATLCGALSMLAADGSRGAAPPAPPRHAAHSKSDPAPKSDSRLRTALKQYGRWLDTLVARDDVPGFATAVIVDGHVRYERTLGYTDTETHERVRPNTVFRIASLSKAFATALTGLLVRDGRLSWDTKLVDVLPFFKLKDMQQAQQATVRDILGQRLGLPRNTFDLQLEDDVPYPELARELDQVNLTCEVGQCYGYQNVAFSLIGDVVYERTGDFFTHQVEKRIFLPLGMTTATYGLENLEHSTSWARPHRRTRHGWVPFMPNADYYHVAPAAGVNASLRDMEQWVMAQLGERPGVLPAALLDELHAPAIDTPSETWNTRWRRARVRHAWYALGWRVYDYAGTRIIFHAGAVRGYRSMIALLPQSRTGIVMLWNGGGTSAGKLMPMLLDSLLGLRHVDWAGLEHPPRRERRRR